MSLRDDTEILDSFFGGRKWLYRVSDHAGVEIIKATERTSKALKRMGFAEADTLRDAISHAAREVLEMDE